MVEMARDEHDSFNELLYGSIVFTMILDQSEIRLHPYLQASWRVAAIRLHRNIVTGLSSSGSCLILHVNQW